MPAGAVCECGALTRHPSGYCDRCRVRRADEYAARRRIYDSPRWKRTSQAAMLRDEYRCVKCGRVDPQNRGGTLDAHHVVPVLELENPFDLELVETRCKWCHARG